MANLKSKEKVCLFQKYEIRFQALISFATADLNLNTPIRLEYGQDRMSYTDGSKIHIGLDGIDAESEDEFLTIVEYVLGHEIQHVRSSPQQIMIWFLQEAVRRFLRNAAKKIDGGKRRRLHNDSDYNGLITDLEKAGYKLKKNSLMEFFHFIFNSVEDGRIEKIRSDKRKGFREKVAIVRGKNWINQPCWKDPVEDMPPEQKLITITNQILNLSTMSIYQKGFLDTYRDTELHAKVKAVIPYIRNGVKSLTCKDNADECLNIVDELSEEILEAVKYTELDKLISQLIKALMDDSKSDFNNSNMPEEKNENSSGQAGTQPFGYSDMEEKKDDSKKKDGESSSSDKGDSDDEADKENSSTDKGNSDKGKSTDKDSSESGQTDQKADGNDSKNGEGKGKSESDCKKEPENSKNKDQKAEIEYNKENAGGGSGSKSSACDGQKGDVEQILKAMQEAANKEKSNIAQIKEAVKPIKKASAPVTAFEPTKEDVKPNPKAGNVTKLYPRTNFQEFTRQYKVKLDMPFDLKGRSNTFKKKIINVIQNQIEPAVRQRKTGKLDASMIYKLPMRQFDIFMRNKRVKKTSACCYMLCDNSGSMGYGPDSKREYLWRAIAEFEAGFSLLMPLKIVAFDTNGQVCHEVIKDWYERNDKSFAYNFLELGRSGGGNMDGYSISIATDEILRQNGKKKVLLVFSDGAPDSYGKTKEAVDYARNCGITVIGIYFSNAGTTPTNSEKCKFESMYGTNGHAIVTSPEYIGEELYKIMKREFL